MTKTDEELYQEYLKLDGSDKYSQYQEEGLKKRMMDTMMFQWFVLGKRFEELFQSILDSLYFWKK